MTSGVTGAVIAGGGWYDNFGPGLHVPNKVTDLAGTVSGGIGNVAGSDNTNLNDSPYAAVSGGAYNTASGYASTVPRRLSQRREGEI